MFITATDTGVGKTIITLALARSLMEKGIKVGVMKPVSTGPAKENDAVLLKEILQLDDPLDIINPVHFEKPLAPYAILKKQETRNPSTVLGAGKIQTNDKTQNIKRSIFTAYEKLKKRYAVVLVEGIGGVMVPVTRNYLVLDLIQDFGLETIVVARAGLGTINHTLLTLEQLKSRKIKIAGVVMNGYTGHDLSEKTNHKVIEDLGGVKVLAKIKRK